MGENGLHYYLIRFSLIISIISDIGRPVPFASKATNLV